MYTLMLCYILSNFNKKAFHFIIIDFSPPTPKKKHQNNDNKLLFKPQTFSC